MTPARLQATLNRLRNFSKLPPAQQVRQQVIDNAELFILRTYLRFNLSANQVMAGLSGEIFVTFSKADNYIDVTLDDDNSVYITHEVTGQPDIDHGPLTIIEADHTLQEIFEKTWAPLSEFYRLGTSFMTKDAGSPVWHSGRLQKRGAVEFQCLTKNVRYGLAAASTHISSGFIATSLRGLEAFTGCFLSEIYQTTIQKFLTAGTVKTSAIGTSWDYLPYEPKISSMPSSKPASLVPTNSE